MSRFIPIKPHFKFMIELSTSLLIFLSALNTNMTTATANTAVAKETAANEVPIVNVEHPLTLEMYVRQYYKDTPLLAEISRCESTFKHYDKEGNLVRGIVNKDDVGVMQINEYYHSATAEKLGYDLHTVDGNLAYAKYLYEKSGPQPWSASSPCWGKAATQLGVKF